METQNLSQALAGIEGFTIGIFLNPNQYIEALLMDVKKDHLVVKVKEHTFYISLGNVRAISKNAKEIRMAKTTAEHLNKEYLDDLLNELKYKWVSINSITSQNFAGMLTRIYNQYIILVNGEEQYFILKDYISNIYDGKFEDSQAEATVEIDKENVKGLYQQPACLDDQTCPTGEVQEPIPPFPITEKEERPTLTEKTMATTEIDKGNNSIPSAIEKENVAIKRNFVIQKPTRVEEKDNKEDVVSMSQRKVLKGCYQKSKEKEDQPSSANVPQPLPQFRLRPVTHISKRKLCEYLPKKYTQCNEKPSTIESISSFQQKQKEESLSKTPKLSTIEQKIMMEKQYFALMKHAEKKYNQLKNERLNR